MQNWQGISIEWLYSLISIFLSIKEKFEITQKLLIKVDKELEQQKVNKNTDSGKFMEIINKVIFSPKIILILL